MALFVDICQKNNIMYKIEDVFEYMRKFETNVEQLTLF